MTDTRFDNMGPLSRRFREKLQDLADNVVRRDELTFGPNILHRNVPGHDLFIDAIPRDASRHVNGLLAKITGLGSNPGEYTATQVLPDGSTTSNPIVWDGGDGNRPALNLVPGGFGPAINKVVTVKRGADGSGNPIWYFENDQPFLANITGNAAFDNRFKYAWSEVTFGSDTTASVSGGRSGTTESGYALNLWETNFTSQYAWAVDKNAEPYTSSTMKVMPVGGGGADTTHRINTPVWMWEVVVADQLAYWFNAPGGHDGGCAAE